MMLALPAASSARARINRVRWWWQRHMGWPGLLAVLVLIGAGATTWIARPAIATAQRDLLRAHVARLDAASRLRAAGPVAGTRDPRDTARDALPSASRRSESIATLLDVLDKGKVAADRAEYTAEDQEPGLVRVRVVVPIEGGYGPSRQMIASILNALPNAALDGVDLERPAESAESLTGQLRLSLFFRREAP
ncbi:MAG: hypothetical protein ABL916_24090 [Burkholderiaceae bacterium]